MASIKSFEDLEIWKEGRKINREIYSLTQKHSFSKDFALKDQIRRASISIMANIAEGFERNSNKEMIYFLSISKGSAGEVLCLLYLALDEKYIPQKEFDHLYVKLRILMQKTGRFIQYLQTSNIRGARYKNTTHP